LDNKMLKDVNLVVSGMMRAGDLDDDCYI
jgi:hypothetical protein